MIEKLKQLAQDTVVYGTAIFLGRFMSFLLTPFYTNYLSKEEFGVISVFFTFYAFLNIMYSFGFDSGFFRFASDKSTEEEKQSVFTMTFLTIAAIASTSTILILLFRSKIAMLIPEVDNAVQWVTIGAFIPLVDALLFIPFSRLRLIRKTIRFGLLRLAIVLLTLLLNVWFIVGMGFGAEGALLAGAISPLVIGLTFIPDIYRNLTRKFDKKIWKEILKYSAPTVPASLAVIALQFIDQPLLKAMQGAEAVAVYAANYKLALPMMMFVSMFEYAWKPFYLSNYKSENAREMFSTVLNYYVAFCGFIFLIVSGFIPYVAKLPIGDSTFYKPSYWSGLYIIPIIMGGYFFNGLFNQFAMGVNIKKATKYLPLAVGIAAIVNLVGNIILIPIYGFTASAWLTLICYAIAAAIIYRFSNKVFPINYEWKRIVTVGFSVLLIYFGSIYLDRFFSGSYSSVPDFLAVLIYPIVLYLFGFFNSRELGYIKRLLRLK